MYKYRSRRLEYLLSITASAVVLTSTSLYAANHTATAPATHMQLKDNDGIVVCSSYNNSANSLPMATGCPIGSLTEQLFNVRSDGRWVQIRPSETVRVREEVARHTADAPAVHMQIKDSSGTVVCSAYNTPASSRPVAENCPIGFFTEQLFNVGPDGSWEQIAPNLTVNIDGSAGEDPVSPNLVFPRNESVPLFTYAENTPFGGIVDTDGRRLELGNDLITENIWDDPSDEFYGRPSKENSPGEQPLGLGNFRVSCLWSHFNYDDPIAAPNEKNGAHLHMFFGNTKTNYTTLDGPLLTASGGGTCNGFALNRSAYWVPALMDGNDNTALVPQSIIVYYKTRKVCKDMGGNPRTNCQAKQGRPNVPANPAGIDHSAYDVLEMPQGLELISGNKVGVNLNNLADSEDSQHVFWSCGSSGFVLGKKRFNRIPSKRECLDLARAEGRDQSKVTINATVYFPQCWVGDANSNGTYSEDELTSDDPFNWTHVRQVSVDEKCPAEAPYRIPQLSFLLYWSLDDVDETTDWYLSSDKNHNGDFIGRRGGTLHADWMAGWDENTMETWVVNCLRHEKNCNFGQTGTDNKLRHNPQSYNGHPQPGMFGGQAQGSYTVTIPSKPHSH